MDTNEAFELTLVAVEELKQQGIKVEIKPYPAERIDDECVKKYTGSECADFTLWCNVRFYPETEEDAEKIYRKSIELSHQGIGFDTGGTKGIRDWELDWSFSYYPRDKKKVENNIAGKELLKTIHDELKM